VGPRKHMFNRIPQVAPVCTTSVVFARWRQCARRSTLSMSCVTRAQQQLRWATVATIGMSREVGVLCPFLGELGPHVTQCGLGRGLLHVNWHFDPCSCLATIHDPILGCCVPFLGERGLHLTQCRLGQGLPSYQVAS